MVSHLDDDHVNGIVMLSNDLINMQDDKMLFDVQNFWFNSFDDIIGNNQLPEIAALPSSAKAASPNMLPLLKGIQEDTAAVIASTGQGRQLRDNAATLSIPVNSSFKPIKRGAGKLIRGDGKGSKIDWDQLKITVLHPTQERLIAFQEKWDQDLKVALKKGDKSIIIAAINDRDKSPFNLSSIVCLIEFGKKKILLTGDSRSDDIYNALKQANLLDKNGKFHVNILKIPHHGSFNNASDLFYDCVTADNYVVSADGKHDNPDQAWLDLFASKSPTGIIYFVNRDGEKQLKTKMDAWVKKQKKINPDLNVVFRNDKKNGFIINLAKEVNY